jgi:anthranilate phosphoribosyltransferase
VKEYAVTNETFGYPEVKIADIKGDTPAHNAQMITRLFAEREKNAPFYVVAANAALGLYAAGFSDRIEACRDAAEEAILSGEAAGKLEAFVSFGNSVQ